MKDTETFDIPVTNNRVPALLVPAQSPSRGTVLVYPGLGASKEIQLKELNWLAAAGFNALAIDAPHHGARADGYLENLANFQGVDLHGEVMQIVDEALAELPAIIDFCLARLQGQIGLTGISLGGFITFGGPLADRRLAAVVPILGSPDWRPKSGNPSPKLRGLMAKAAVNFPASFAPCPVLAINAGKDGHVPPDSARRFIEDLRPYYHACPEHLQYSEYPESDHFMREADWQAVWRQTIGWFARFLPG